MMWLERIDPRLPKKFSATFAHQMVYNTSLRDLPPIISACLPSLLQELDETAANCACLHVVNADGQTPTVAAASFPRQNSRFRGQRRFQSAKPKFSGKFCRICFLLNKNSPNTVSTPATPSPSAAICPTETSRRCPVSPPSPSTTSLTTQTPPPPRYKVGQLALSDPLEALVYLPLSVKRLGPRV